MCDGLGERVVLHGQRDIAAQQLESVEFAVFVEGVPLAAAKGYHSREAAAGLQRREALE